jgi:hypothetical protein
MWRGQLRPADPTPTTLLYIVVWSTYTPDIKNRSAKRKVGLQRWNRRLPDGT